MTHLRRMALESPETLAEAPVELVGELGVLRGGRGREGPDHQHGSLGQEREPVPEQVAQPSLHHGAGDGGADRLGDHEPGTRSAVGRSGASLEKVHDEQGSADAVSAADDLTELVG